jgi:hypothetical protein
MIQGDLDTPRTWWWSRSSTSFRIG